MRIYYGTPYADYGGTGNEVAVKVVKYSFEMSKEGDSTLQAPDRIWFNNLIFMEGFIMSRNDVWKKRNLGRLGITLAFIMLVTSNAAVDTLAEEMIDVPAPGIEEEMKDVPAPGIDEIAEVPSPAYSASATSVNASGQGSVQLMTGSSEGMSGTASSGNSTGNVAVSVNASAQGTGSAGSSANTSGLDTAYTGTDTAVKLVGTKVITRAKDKKKVTITIPESESSDARHVLNINTGAYHVQHGICSSELAMKEEHRVYTNASSDTIKSWYYLPCDRCDPDSQLSATQTAGGSTQTSGQANVNQASKASTTGLHGSAVASSNNAGQAIENSTSVNEPQKQEAMVWLSKTGKCYHNRSNCGKMKAANAKLVTLSEAIAKGKKRCSKCKW